MAWNQTARPGQKIRPGRAVPLETICGIAGKPEISGPGRGAWDRRSSRDQVLHANGVVPAAQNSCPGRAGGAFWSRSRSSSTPRPGRSGRLMQPSTICSGALVRRSSPSCQIQWVSMPLSLPTAAAALGHHGQGDIEVVVGVAPHIRPKLLHIWPTRTEPAMVQK